MATGLADDLELWWEYEQASHDRRQLTWSRDLRKWAGLSNERSDEKIAATDKHGVTVPMLAGDTWTEVRTEAHELLTIAELADAAAAQNWLDRRVLAWLIPNQEGTGHDAIPRRPFRRSRIDRAAHRASP